MFHKTRQGFFGKAGFSNEYFPVVDLSKGGACFLTNDRFRPGKPIIVRFDIPGHDLTPEIQASIRWVAKNPEQSYKYQTGVSFNAYGDGRKENPKEILHFLETLESKV